MTPDILADVQRANAEARRQRGQEPKLRQDPFMREVCRQAREVTARHPELMAYLCRTYAAPRCTAPPQGVTLGEWSIRNIAAGEVLAALYDLAAVETEEPHHG